MPEFKPQIDKQITDWSGIKTGEQDVPRPTAFPAARELFGPTRRLADPNKSTETPAPVKRAPRPNYKLPE